MPEQPEPCRYCGAQIGRVEELLRRAATVVETSPETPKFAAELRAQADELAALTKPPALPKEGEEANLLHVAYIIASAAGVNMRCAVDAARRLEEAGALSSLPVRSGEVEKRIEALRSALNFYADPKRHIGPDEGIPDFYDEMNFGLNAEEALERDAALATPQQAQDR